MEISFQNMTELYLGYYFNIPTSYICSCLLESICSISNLLRHIHFRRVHKIAKSKY